MNLEQLGTSQIRTPGLASALRGAGHYVVVELDGNGNRLTSTVQYYRGTPDGGVQPSHVIQEPVEHHHKTLEPAVAQAIELHRSGTEVAIYADGFARTLLCESLTFVALANQLGATA